MKSKILLVLSACCFLVSLGLMVGLAISPRLQAQSKEWCLENSLYSKPLPVRLSEDFMRNHGKQIKSYCVVLDGEVLLDVVPAGKKFIVTDFLANRTNTIWLSTQSGTTVARVGVTLGESNSPLQTSLRSGIVFEPGEEIWLKQSSSSPSVYFTVSGYYVDL